jgi:hypothetical protein
MVISFALRRLNVFIRAMRTALIVGISGDCGKSLLQGLLNNRHYKQIVVLTRRENRRLKNIHLKRVMVDFARMQDNIAHFQEVDDVFCLLGTEYIDTRNLDEASKFDYEYPLSVAQVAKEAGVKNFYLLNPSKLDINSTNKIISTRARLELEIGRLGFENFVVFRVNKIRGPVNMESTLYATKKGVGSLINLLGMGLINKIKATPSNILSQKIITTALSNLDNKKEFLPEDY